MNENTHFLTALYVITGQLQNMKEKIDPEVYELLRQSGHEAIASAQHFLDACDLALDNLMDSEPMENSDEVNLSQDDIENVDINETDNIIELNIVEK